MLWSKTRETARLKRRSWYSSRANALTMRIPETFSSASAVSSAIRCWTSCRAGRVTRVQPGGVDKKQRAGVRGNHVINHVKSLRNDLATIIGHRIDGVDVRA